MPPTLDAGLLTAWAGAAVAALERHRVEVDRINVFPVADGDTGTNMLLTMRAAADATGAATAVGVAVALAHGALVGARGNSGAILSQLLRGLAEAVMDPTARPDGAVLADGLRRGARLARAALSRPRTGTALTVMQAAADGAAGHDDLEVAAVAAVGAAESALRDTTGQLPELARAGVVDSGGLGVYLVLDALAATAAGHLPTTTLPRATGGRVPLRGRDALVGDRESGSPDFDYEVMYLLDGADAASVEDLRHDLERLGDCVAVIDDGGLGAGVGGTPTWNVHVHCADIGAAIEAGIAVGRPHRITVIRFPDTAVGPAAVVDTRFVTARAVLMVVTGAELAELARSAGAQVLERRPTEPVTAAELTAALAATKARHVVLLPDDAELTFVAERAAGAARRGGQEVLVVPTASVLQGLSALAVHDPNRSAGEDVVAMAEAAAGTRTAGLVVAESEALTWVGHCQPGDVLGVSDGEVVLIAPDLAVGALWLAHRMLLGGGEIVTALLGAGVDEELGEGLALDLRRTHPEVDVVVQRGGQTDYQLVLGVE